MKKSTGMGRMIGILALQGDFEAHRKVLEDRLEMRTMAVRSLRDLSSVDALVLPGGESTTIIKLLARIELIEPIRGRAAAGMPIYGTCAGMILMAKSVADRPDQQTLELMDIDVRRNAFGRQVDSFEAELHVTLSGNEEPVRGVFIRAPIVCRRGANVVALSEFESQIVAVRQGALIATAFHPELTDNEVLHRHFAAMVNESQERK